MQVKGVTMERGDRTVAVGVLALVAVVGLLATVQLFSNPTGSYVAEQGVFVMEDNPEYALECENRLQQAVFLGYNGQYQEYCCLENYDATSNSCSWIRRILIARTY